MHRQVVCSARVNWLVKVEHKHTFINLLYSKSTTTMFIFYLLDLLENDVIIVEVVNCWHFR